MSMQTARDVPLIVRSENASAERRITPSWNLAQLKTKLEPVTGIPPSAQKLTLRVPGQLEVLLEARDEETVEVGRWNLQAYAEIYVTDTSPPSARLNLNPSNVEKYIMPAETYATLPSTVLSWKKSHHLGRFDPTLPEKTAQREANERAVIESRNIVVGARCRLGGDDARRGRVAFVGDVEEIPGGGGPWVGVELDEPVGKNDGSVGGKRYFECGQKRGVFVRAERVEVGNFGVLMDEEGLQDSDLEEI